MRLTMLLSDTAFRGHLDLQAAGSRPHGSTNQRRGLRDVITTRVTSYRLRDHIRERRIASQNPDEIVPRHHDDQSTTTHRSNQHHQHLGSSSSSRHEMWMNGHPGDAVDRIESSSSLSSARRRFPSPYNGSATSGVAHHEDVPPFHRRLPRHRAVSHRVR